jgi:hypothetical protein
MSSSLNIAEIKQRADIREVWAALGGGPLRRNRARAFWRSGTGFNVSLDVERGLWHDHRDNLGGDVVELVRTVQGCGFLQAAEWLAAHAGVRVSEWIRRDDEAEPTGWASDLKWAVWWGFVCELMAEWALEELPPAHRERFELTKLLAKIRLGDQSLVDEYRAWRRRDPAMTTAMAQAGRRLDAQRQKRLALWLRRYVNVQET